MSRGLSGDVHGMGNEDIGNAIDALAASTAYLAALMEEIADKEKDIRSNSKSFFIKIKSLYDKLLAKAKAFVGKMKDLVDKIIAKGKQLTAKAKGWFKGIWGKAKGLWGKIKAKAKVFMDKAKGLYDKWKSKVKGLINKAKGLWGKAKSLAKGWLGKAKGLWGKMKGKAKGFGSKWRGKAKGLWGKMRSKAKGLWGKAKGFVSKFKAAYSDTEKGFVGKIKGYSKKVGKLINDTDDNGEADSDGTKALLRAGSNVDTLDAIPSFDPEYDSSTVPKLEVLCGSGTTLSPDGQPVPDEYRVLTGGLAYLLRKIDIVPDYLSGIGTIDDYMAYRPVYEVVEYDVLEQLAPEEHFTSTKDPWFGDMFDDVNETKSNDKLILPPGLSLPSSKELEIPEDPIPCSMYTSGMYVNGQYINAAYMNGGFMNGLEPQEGNFDAETRWSSEKEFDAAVEHDWYGKSTAHAGAAVMDRESDQVPPLFDVFVGKEWEDHELGVILRSNSSIFEDIGGDDDKQEPDPCKSGIASGVGLSINGLSVKHERSSETTVAKDLNNTYLVKKGRSDEIPVMFNPEKVHVKKSIPWDTQSKIKQKEIAMRRIQDLNLSVRDGDDDADSSGTSAAETADDKKLLSGSFSGRYEDNELGLEAGIELREEFEYTKDKVLVNLESGSVDVKVTKSQFGQAEIENVVVDTRVDINDSKDPGLQGSITGGKYGTGGNDVEGTLKVGESYTYEHGGEVQTSLRSGTEFLACDMPKIDLDYLGDLYGRLPSYTRDLEMGTARDRSAEKIATDYEFATLDYSYDKTFYRMLSRFGINESVKASKSSSDETKSDGTPAMGPSLSADLRKMNFTKEVGEEFEVMFNPATLQFDKTVPWTEQADAGFDIPNVQFTSGKGTAMSARLFSNTYGPDGSANRNLMEMTKQVVLPDDNNIPSRSTKDSFSLRLMSDPVSSALNASKSNDEEPGEDYDNPDSSSGSEGSYETSGMGRPGYEILNLRAMFNGLKNLMDIVGTSSYSGIEMQTNDNTIAGDKYQKESDKQELKRSNTSTIIRAHNNLKDVFSPDMSFFFEETIVESHDDGTDRPDRQQGKKLLPHAIIDKNISLIKPVIDGIASEVIGGLGSIPFAGGTIGAATSVGFATAGGDDALRIAGYDKFHRLSRGTNSRTWGDGVDRNDPIFSVFTGEYSEADWEYCEPAEMETHMLINTRINESRTVTEDNHELKGQSGPREKQDDSEGTVDRERSLSDKSSGPGGDYQLDLDYHFDRTTYDKRVKKPSADVQPDVELDVSLKILKDLAIDLGNSENRSCFNFGVIGVVGATELEEWESIMGDPHKATAVCDQDGEGDQDILCQTVMFQPGNEGEPEIVMSSSISGAVGAELDNAPFVEGIYRSQIQAIQPGKDVGTLISTNIDDEVLVGFQDGNCFMGTTASFNDRINKDRTSIRITNITPGEKPDLDNDVVVKFSSRNPDHVAEIRKEAEKDDEGIVISTIIKIQVDVYEYRNDEAGNRIKVHLRSLIFEFGFEEEVTEQDGDTIIFHEDLDGSHCDLFTVYLGSDWDIGDPSLDMYGPYSTTSGPNCVATKTYDTYSTNSYSLLWTPIIDLKNYNSATLSFQHFYDIEAGYDGGRVLVTTDGGVTWSVLTPQGGYPSSSVSVFNGPGYTGLLNPNWVMEGTVFSLNNWCGQEIRVAWQFVADGSVEYDGWYVDGILITGS
jgi:uncharacterized membrane protein YkvA (DUF1232 family)